MSLMDFSAIEQEINNAPAPHILDKGTEVQVRIISSKEGVSEKNNAKWFIINFDVPSDPMAKEFSAFFWNPLDNNKLDEKQKQQNNYAFQQFVKCFGIDLKSFDLDSIVGKKGWVITGIKKDEEYGDKNSISKYVVSGGSTTTPSSY